MDGKQPASLSGPNRPDNDSLTPDEKSDSDEKGRPLQNQTLPTGAISKPVPPPSITPSKPKNATDADDSDEGTNGNNNQNRINNNKR